MIERINKRAAESGAAVRNDDNEDVLKKRFKTFRESSMPIVEIFEKQGKVKRINSMQEEESVFADVLKAFDGYLGKPLPKKEDKTIKANPAAVAKAAE